MSDTHFTRSGSSPGDAFCTSGSSPTQPLVHSLLRTVLVPLPIQRLSSSAPTCAGVRAGGFTFER